MESMRQPDVPAAFEAARLAALRSYDILDTPSEEVFDQFVRLAASITGTPTALISLVDGSRQWFKARVGMTARQTPRDVAFCDHAIRGHEVFVVPDATQDTRFASNPLVTEDPHIRFYAGAPLLAPDGHALGTLCVIDYAPRKFSSEQRRALQSLSALLMEQLELRRKLAQFSRSGEAHGKIMSELRRAVASDEFVLFYQPTFNVRTGHITSLEALIRWDRPGVGITSPAEFLPVLESSGMIVEVGAWVMRRAAADYRRWLERGLAAPRITVNVSPLQLLHGDFVSHLLAAVEPEGEGRVPLDIEITEGVLMQDTPNVIARLREIQQLGVHIAVDDFGTGYSSLRYLARLPVDTLKIDRSFVAQMTENADDMGVVSSIISLAHSLRLDVVAEGVETAEQRKLLRLLRCDHMQGYIFSQPVPREQMEVLLRRDQEASAAEWQQVLEEAANRNEVGCSHAI